MNGVNLTTKMHDGVMASLVEAASWHVHPPRTVHHNIQVILHIPIADVGLLQNKDVPAQICWLQNRHRLGLWVWGLGPAFFSTSMFS